MNRRTYLKYSAGVSAMLGLGMTPWSLTKVATRTIPSSGEPLPMVGVGTWQTFDVGSGSEARTPIKGVIKALIELGGSVIDSSPMYGRSEHVIGALCSELGVSNKVFGATKVWTQGENQGKSQMERSMERMAQNPMDLMQIHNLVDWKTHLKTLMNWKEEGKIRYLGITHYQKSAYHRMEQIMKSYPLDFIQVNYSMGSPDSGERLLPLAQELGIAVIINRPYQGGSLFGHVRNKPMPAWSDEIDCTSWAQFFLKYIISNPAVTCAIPGTSQESHLRENLGSGSGILPDAGQRTRMLKYFKDL